MAVYPDKIVLKSSTDGDGLIKETIDPTTGIDPIVPGELVISRGFGEARLWTIDANNQPVPISQGTDLLSAAPAVILNFEGDGTDTPVDLLDIGVTNPVNYFSRFGSGSFYSNADYDELFKTRMLIQTEHAWDIGTGQFTLEFWVFMSPQSWPERDGGLETGTPINYQSLIGNNDYPYGPGSFNVFVDAGGTNGVTGRSDVNFGAIVLGLSTGESRPDLYPVSEGYDDLGYIVSSKNYTVCDNKWHHVVFQHLGDGNYTCHIDGRLAETTNYNQPINFDDHGQEEGRIPHPVGINFGGQGVGTIEGPYNQNGFNGYIDALAMFQGIARYGTLPAFVVPNDPPTAGEIVFPQAQALGDLRDVYLSSYDEIKNNAPLVWNKTAGYWTSGSEFRPAPFGSASFVDYAVDPTSGTRSSITISLPNHKKGDLLIAVIMYRSDAGNVTAPAGWTDEGDHGVIGQGSGAAPWEFGEQRLRVFTKEADLGEPAQIDFVTDGSDPNRMAGIIVSAAESAFNGVFSDVAGEGPTIAGNAPQTSSNLVVSHWILADAGVETSSVTDPNNKYVQLTPEGVVDGRLAAAWGYGGATMTTTHSTTAVQPGSGNDDTAQIVISVRLDSVLNLDVISDVEYSPLPQTDDILIYDQDTWRPAANSLANLGDTNIVNPADTEVLQYNGTEWVNAGAPAYDISGNDLGDIGDVTLSGTATGDFLRWDGTQWVNDTLEFSDITGDVTFGLAALTDVDDALAPTEDQVLSYNGTQWVAASRVISDAADVDTETATPGVGSFLAWDGANWVPAIPVSDTNNGISLASYTVDTVATGADGNGVFSSMGSMAQMVEIVSDADCWLTFYANDAARVADANRVYAADPLPGSGVLAEFNLTQAIPVTVTPPIQLFNNSQPVQDAFFILARLQDGTTIEATITLAAYSTGIVTSISGGSFGSG